MKYYAVPASLLKEHGMGEETWRKRKGSEVLINEAEVVERLGYPDLQEFEEETGATPMVLKDAKNWTDNR